ncbi:8680_t:CDS:2, partial [Paraglomus brasilianum]
MELRLRMVIRMVMDCVSAVESKKKGHIADFWLKSLPGLKCNNRISTENVFVSCDLDGIQISNGIQFGGSRNNFQKPKQLYRNHKQMSVEEVVPTKKISVNKDCDDEPGNNSPLND